MDIDLARCVVRLGLGEKIAPELAATLDPVNIASIRWYKIPTTRPTEMHYHDYDEYWLFTAGETVVRLRLENGTSQEFEVKPGTLIVTPRGVEHAHTPRTEMQGAEWSSVLRPGVKRGHLQR
jgi:mannose-6-phosphate isomerase-like protein (cupin superfamily)